MKDFTKIFMDEIYSKPPENKFPTSRKLFNHIDELWNIDLMDMSDHEVSSDKGVNYFYVTFDNFSKKLCSTLLKKTSRTKTRLNFYIF